MSLTQQELESYLWGAAVILRGLVDAGDYKQFVFPLLFYKRLSDVWDEEYALAMQDAGADHAYAVEQANTDFVIPDGAHWTDVRAVAKERKTLPTCGARMRKRARALRPVSLAR